MCNKQSGRGAIGGKAQPANYCFASFIKKRALTVVAVTDELVVVGLTQLMPALRRDLLKYFKGIVEIECCYFLWPIRLCFPS